jgi:hypothetical protein
VADLRAAGCGLSWPKAIKSTSLYFARKHDKSALRDFPQAPTGIRSPPQSQAAIPSQASTSCEAGASTARSQDGQPSPSGNSERRKTPERSRRRFPSGPSTQTVPPSTRRASTLTTKAFKAEATQLTAGVLGSARLRAFTQSQRPTRRLNRHSHLVTAHPPAPAPRQTPLSSSHLVGAHPPCSRKGPLLPACGPKCPWRVKREATNSRFCGPVGLCQISAWWTRPPSPFLAPVPSGPQLPYLPPTTTRPHVGWVRGRRGPRSRSAVPVVFGTPS